MAPELQMTYQATSTQKRSGTVTLEHGFMHARKLYFPSLKGVPKSFARVGMKRRRILQAALAQVSHPCMLKKGKIAYMDERLLATQIIGKKNACQSCRLCHLC